MIITLLTLSVFLNHNFGLRRFKEKRSKNRIRGLGVRVVDLHFDKYKDILYI